MSLQNMNRDDSIIDMRQMLISKLKTYLDKHKMKECLELIRNEQMKVLIANDCELIWDLLPLICSRLRGLNEFRFKTFQACEEMLMELSRIYKPKEVLIALLAELENNTRASDVNDDNCFKAILKPLEYVLKCLPNKRNETLKWVLITLNSHIEKLEIPDELNLEGKERLLYDQQNQVKRINKILPLYMDFIESFVREVDLLRNDCESTVKLSSKTSNPNVQRTILLKALLRLNEHPLLYLDLNGESQSESLKYANRVVCLIAKLQPNFYILSERNDLISECKNKSEETEILLSQTSFDLSIANVLYLITCESASPPSFIPYVYTHVYLFSVNLKFIDVLLRRNQSLICEKGLMLANAFLMKINDNELKSSFMHILRQNQIEKWLIQIMVFSTIQSHRQLALKVFRKLISCFDSAGRYKFMYSILSQPNQHSGVKGLIIGMYKNELLNDDNSYFIESNMNRIVKASISSSLPNGVESDLLENNDVIFATLNLLRFVCLKDSKHKNHTKIWDLREYITESLIKPLHRAIDLSRAHYKLELRKVTEEKVKQIIEKRKNDNSNSVNFEVKIGGNDNVLPHLPSDHQHKILLYALQNFDLIESILVRVEEIIND